MTTEQDSAYGSHRPVLGLALAALPRGPVLELGMGNASTPYLRDICERQGCRLLCSYDHDAEWAVSFKPGAGQLVRYVASFDQVPIEDRLWAVALVDHAPAHRRITEIERLREYAMLIVVHDTEPKHARAYNYEPILTSFRYRWDYRPAGLPHTTVVSTCVDVPWIFEGRL